MIWNYCIRRPVRTIVVFLIVGIFGFYGYNQLPVREFPDVEFPVVNVNVVLPGAEPEVIETEVLEPLEEELNTIEGLKELRSSAREEVGNVTAEFELWRDIDIAAQDVRDRVNRAQREIPNDAEAPIVRKQDPDAQAIMWLAIQGDDRWDTVELTEYVDNQLKPQVETLRGVGRIQIGGEQKLAVRIRLNHEKMAAHGVTVGDVVDTIQANNVDIPSGRVEGKTREFLVKTQGQFSGPEPFNDLIIRYQNGSPVRIGDVGQAVEGVENNRTLARFRGKPAVGMGIVKQSDANTVRLADTVRDRIEQLSDEFPPGIQYTVAGDDSQFVQENINDLQMTIIIATILVVLVILFFLRSGWATLIAAVAIPTSLATGMALIYSFGFSLNVLTMLAFILVIGIVVDDAIVVIESVYRHLEEGASQMAGARVGTTEIAFAAIANTLALGAVFLPVAFTQGMIGRFFYEFGVTVAVTVFASTATALTLTPLMSSRLLTVPDRSGWFWRWTESFFNRLESAYETSLEWSLSNRYKVILIAVLALAAGVYFFVGLDKEFSPSEDRGEFIISFETPEGATLEETDDYAQKIEGVLEDVPEINRYFLAIGLSQGGPGKVNSGISFVRMSHRTERERTHLEIMDEVRQRLSEFPSGRAYVLEPGGPGGGGAPLQVVLQHEDLGELAAQQEKIMGWMRQQNDFVGVNSNLKMNKPEVEVTIDRDKASEFGLSVADISNTLRYLLGEPDISEIERGNERYEVIPELDRQSRAVPSLINDFYIRDDSGELVSMANVVNLQEGSGPSEIHHFNRRRSVTIESSTPQDVVLGEAMNKLRGHLSENLPTGFSWTTTGEAQDMQESFFYLTISLVFAVIFVYLVLAAQFESWLHPLTILMSLPLAAVGAYGMLYVLDMTFSVFTFIGTIMLVGLVTKNGILLIDYANIMVQRGHSSEEAAREAGKVRFRPVLMTAISTILGMMPIALGYGAGGEARAPLGWTVAGGMFTATALTLLVIPVVYTLFDELARYVQGNPLRILRYLVGGLLLAAAGWMVYVPVVYGLGWIVLVGAVLGAFLLGWIGWITVMEWPGWSSCLVGLGSLLVVLGLVLGTQPAWLGLTSGQLGQVVDWTATGYAVLILGGLALGYLALKITLEGGEAR